MASGCEEEKLNNGPQLNTAGSTLDPVGTHQTTGSRWWRQSSLILNRLQTENGVVRFLFFRLSDEILCQIGDDGCDGSHRFDH